MSTSTAAALAAMLGADATLHLASGSALKRDAVTAALTTAGAVDTVTLAPATLGVGGSTPFQQPVGLADAFECAVARVDSVTTANAALTALADPATAVADDDDSEAKDGKEDKAAAAPAAVVIAVENFIEQDDTGVWTDAALVLLVTPFRRFQAVSARVLVPEAFTPRADDDTLRSVTVGARIHAADTAVPADDWFHHFPCNEGRPQRRVQIADAVTDVLAQMTACAALQTQIDVFPDYPAPGVDFLDLWSLFASSQSQAQLVTALCGQVRAHLGPHVANEYVVAGLELRGVMIGCMISSVLGVPFVPVRKANNKLPGAVVTSESFATEYSAGDAFKVQTQYLERVPKKCIVIDDIIATGGSLLTGCSLLESVGLEVALVVAVMDVPGLRDVWRPKLRKYTVATCIE